LESRGLGGRLAFSHSSPPFAPISTLALAGLGGENGPIMRLTTQQIDWLNIGFMIASAAVACVLPFEAFLFAYAVLGPLHYLTEISWLQQRNYFTSGKRDYLWLLLIGFALFVTAFLVPWREMAGGGQLNRFWNAGLPYLAFVAALAMAVFRKPAAKFLCVFGGLALLYAMMNWPVYTLIFGVFLPTLIHVYVFTGLFMLYGTLKSRSAPGYVGLAIFLACPFVLMFWPANPAYVVSEYGRLTYPLFQELNLVILRLIGVTANDQSQLHQALYASAAGIAIMRCIAFAYTYHYLNWFAKTSIIKWHLVSGRRLAAIAALWLISVGVYVYDYRVGFVALATLSFLHVFLEFPLNHRTIVGIGAELKNRWLRATSDAPRSCAPRVAVAERAR
jgi:hypothetical protein